VNRPFTEIHHSGFALLGQAKAGDECLCEVLLKRKLSFLGQGVLLVSVDCFAV
jgi:hypothetical protein